MRLLLDQLAALKSLLSGRFRDFTAIWKAHFYYFKNRKALFSQHSVTGRDQIDEPDGVYTRSLVWDYFIGRKKKFSDLKMR